MKWSIEEDFQENRQGCLAPAGLGKLLIFNTICAEFGYPSPVFDTLLGHKVAGIAGVYTRLSPSGGILAEASQATADLIAAAMDGQKPRLGEKFSPDQIPQGSGAKEASA